MRAATLPLGKKYNLRKELVESLLYGLPKTPMKKSKAMKRIGNLYQKIISIENLKLADQKARKGKSELVAVKLPTGETIFKHELPYGIRLFDKNKEENLLKLHEALLTKMFKTSPYEVFPIYEPKERIIYRLPYYPDRIVHHAIMNILEPIWVRTFTHNTYSCVKGRGIDGCARHVDKMIRKYKGKPMYCLKIDIKKFYPTIKHDVLKRIVRKKIKDKDLLWLLDEIIDSVNNTLPVRNKHSDRHGLPIRNIISDMNGNPVEVGLNEAMGVPIGNYLSQFLANLYLAYFMHKVNEVWKIDSEEYADDMAFYSESKEKLHKFFHEFVKPYIEQELKMTIKGNYQVFPIAKNRQDKHGRALDYVGFKFYREQKLMRKSIKQNFCRAAARINKRNPPLDAKAYKQAVAPWLGWAKHSNSKHLLKTIIKKEYYDTCVL